MSEQDLRWPGGKRIAVLFNLCLEQWSDGKAPGISPMGNPLPPGVLDMTAISWAAFGCRRGIYRLLDGLGQHGAKATVMTNAVVAERYPEAVKAVAKAGHEVASHSYSMDVIPAFLSEEDEKKNLDRCSALLEQASGKKVVGWLSPRATSTARTPALLARAGYRWYGDILDDDLPYVLTFDNRPIVAIPLQTDVNDMPFMKHGSVPATTLDAFDENLRLCEKSSRLGNHRRHHPLPHLRASARRVLFHQDRRARGHEQGRLDRHPLRDGRARAGPSIGSLAIRGGGVIDGIRRPVLPVGRHGSETRRAILGRGVAAHATRRAARLRQRADGGALFPSLWRLQPRPADLPQRRGARSRGPSGSSPARCCRCSTIR